MVYAFCDDIGDSGRVHFVGCPIRPVVNELPASPLRFSKISTISVRFLELRTQCRGNWRQGRQAALVVAKRRFDSAIEVLIDCAHH
jgi:hypothetical protein